MRADIRRTYDHLGGNRLQRVLGCFRTPGLHAVLIFRFGQWLADRPLPVRILLKPVYLVLYHHVRATWGIELSPGATIGEGFLIFHYGGIFVGSKVVIGKGCSISHDVTIGLAGRGNRRGAPVLGDNVYVAPGAKLAGRIMIGANARIGANAVVEKNVPENALVQVGPVKMVTFPGLYSQTDHAGRLDQ